MAKIILVSDFSFKGSGYFNIVVPLCRGLHESGHDVKAVGLGYLGEPHDLPYSILPCNNYSDAHAMVSNLKIQWGADIVIVALDIPTQAGFIELSKRLEFPIIVITPLENPPLTMSWSMLLQQADKVFFISQMGADEAVKAGVESAEHILVGMDTKAWRMRTNEEYVQGRKLFNISDDTLVVLTVADNQERKNLSKAMEIVSKVKHEHGLKVKYILVTRENSDVGWKLRDLAMFYNIASDVIIFERGMPFGELYSLYAMADVFLLTSKAEGLGMPVMEAMSVGVPVVATNCGAMPELLGNNLERGYIMDTEYSMIDPWGNSRRDFPDAEHGRLMLRNLSIDRGSDNSSSYRRLISRAREYMETRTWDFPVSQVDRAIEELLHGKDEA